MEQEQNPFADFIADLAAVVRKHNGTVSANDMLKAFRHLEVDLMTALMVTVRLTPEDKLVVKEPAEEQT